MNKKLTGKVALVTGGSRGIGAAIARSLAEDGADVAISYASSADKAKALVRELQEKGVRAAAFQADQASADEVATLVRKVAEHFGHLDILVNNAGVFITGPVGEVKAEDVARQFAVNVGGVNAAVREAAKLMTAGGRIISIGSMGGTSSPWPGISDYSATKAAVAAYTRGWARDLGPKGITVNVIEPGPIDTDMNRDDERDFVQVLKSGTALGRYGKPEEIGATVAFLASKGASFITGATIAVDGGYNA
ncbi:MAG TPA: 3-oxoacyl-ACP reductase family protein [Steroidobacteraceae bacterium]|nr:3-oxoacyl-ACP reductase family protein [Steroidobacteraceae bacterium]